MNSKNLTNEYSIMESLLFMKKLVIDKAKPKKFIITYFNMEGLSHSL